MEVTETFRPLRHQPPIGIINTLKFYCRLSVDFQMRTIYTHLKKIIPQFKGKILDVGCGNSPFRFLVDNTQASYTGIDITSADNFDCHNPDIMPFDGENIPFPDESIDHIISTEVLEHIENPQQIIAEMYRVLKNGGNAVITIPWSARVHYIPYDYCRYTPFKLNRLFAAFSKITILNRGTDINSIVAKIIVVFMGLISNSLKIKSVTSLVYSLCSIILVVILFPILLIFIAIGHLELLFKFGSINDPLGYTVILQKMKNHDKHYR